MPIFKIWHRGSKEVSIEEGISPGEACQKAGWRSEECEVQLIPENEILNLNEPNLNFVNRLLLNRISSLDIKSNLSRIFLWVDLSNFFNCLNAFVLNS